MPSYPLRPTFPIDVRSPSGTVKVGRQGTAVTVDLNPDRVIDSLPITTVQFFSALEAFRPGASATVQDAVPSDPTSLIYRAYHATAFATPGSVLLAFVKSTLGLDDQQISDLLAAAVFQPK